MGAVFAIAALRKASQPDEALRALSHLAEIVGFPANWVASCFVALVVVELLLATFLLFDLFPRMSSRTAASLLIVFSAWIGYLLLSGTEIGCGCGVKATWLRDADSRWLALGRNGLLLLLALLGAYAVPAAAAPSKHSEEVPLPA